MSCPARSTRLRTKSTVRSPIVFSGSRCSCLLDARPVFALQHPLHARKQFVHIERFAEILVSPSSIRLLIFSACNMLMINAWECSLMRWQTAKASSMSRSIWIFQTYICLSHEERVSHQETVKKKAQTASTGNGRRPHPRFFEPPFEILTSNDQEGLTVDPKDTP